MYDIAIIGLGPAGATLARLLDSGLSVLALDKKLERGEESFHKPCGGLLAPDAQKSLSRFGLTLPSSVLVDPQIFSVRTIDLDSGLVRHYQRFYLNLDRHRFDLWLKSLIPPGVEVHNGVLCSRVERTGEGFLIEWMKDGRTHSATARRVVGADGAASAVRGALLPKANIRRYLSIQQWFDDRHAAPFYCCVFDSEATDCYAWGLSKNGQFVFGGAFEPRGARERFERLKEKLIPHGFNLSGPAKTEACLVLRPAGPGEFCCGENGAFLIGEAAGFVSPSSLEGISYAFDSALALAGVLNDRSCADPDRAYRRATRAIRMRLSVKMAKSPALYTPALRRVVMKSGFGSIPVI